MWHNYEMETDENLHDMNITMLKTMLILAADQSNIRHQKIKQEMKIRDNLILTTNI